MGQKDHDGDYAAKCHIFINFEALKIVHIKSKVKSSAQFYL